MHKMRNSRVRRRKKKVHHEEEELKVPPQKIPIEEPEEVSPLDEMSSSSSVESPAVRRGILSDSESEKETIPHRYIAPGEELKTSDGFWNTILSFVEEAEQDRRFTGMNIENNGTFKGKVRSLFMKFDTERKELEKELKVLREQLGNESGKSAEIVKKSLSRERDIERKLIEMEQEKVRKESEYDEMKRSVYEWKLKWEMSEESARRTRELMAMLKDTHDSLIQSNEYLLHELALTKARQEREAVQWKKNYELLQRRINSS